MKKSKHLIDSEDSYRYVTNTKNAGEKLINWLDGQYYEPYNFDDDPEDTDARHLKMAYAMGYNDARLECLREVASVVLKKPKDPRKQQKNDCDDEDFDEDLEDDDECDCHD